MQLTSLPLFPLGAVLFPGGLLPLRIFEVRYLDMVKKCHAAQVPFGVVRLIKGTDTAIPGQQEQFDTVGTLAQVDSLENPQPGLLSIRCTGTQRFRITHCERLKHGLWVADVAHIAPDQVLPLPDDLAQAARSLRHVIKELKTRTIEPFSGPAQLDDCGWVANRWSELLPLPSDLKQQLMQLESPLMRLELVGDLLGKFGLTEGESN